MQLFIQAQLKQANLNLDIDYEITEAVTAIVGDSGVGKSTLLHMIAGIVRPDSGKIVLNDSCLFDSSHHINLPIHQRQLGLVFQDAKLFPHMTVKKNLCYGRPKHTTIQLHEVSQLLELEPLLKQKPNTLSGGEKQRVALGRAILSEPQLLMLDEPLASLDQRLKQQILPYLRKITTLMHIPMLYISHDPAEIAQITNNILYLAQGKLTPEPR